MLNEELPGKVGELVDLLRSQGDAAKPSLAEIAGVTEVLIATMHAYFNSIDTSLYKEFRDLSEYISNARFEIASLTPKDLEKARIPRAGQELDAIVQSTEEATNTIMEAAEQILGSLGEDDLSAQRDAMEGAVMQIFEACSFQDITGQRISKVVTTLSYIEQRIKDLHDVMGITDEHIQAVEPEVEAIRGHSTDELATGPSLQGEGIDQSEVDALLEGEANVLPGEAPVDTSDQGEVATPDAAEVEEPQAEDVASEDIAEAEVAGKGEQEVADEGKSADDDPDADAGRTTSQEEIDALFG